MKRNPFEVPRRSVTQSLNDIRMPNAVERDRFVLKVLYERLFEVRVRRALQRRVQRLDNNRLLIAHLIVSEEYLRIAPASQAPLDQVTIVNQTVFQSQLRHGLVSKIEDR